MKISTLARYIDQPILLSGLNKKMPALLIGAGAGYGLYDTFKTCSKKNDKEKKQKFLKNTIIITSTIAASLIGARGLKISGKQILPALLPVESVSNVLKRNHKAVEEYLNKTLIKDEKIIDTLNVLKKRALNLKETEFVLNSIPASPEKNKLLNVILPQPENLKAKDIFSEIGRLSLLGAVPVVGGVFGGVVADKITNTQTKDSISNKVKEGFYQYFANIFLCNVGACAALFGAERLQAAKLIKPLTPLKRLLVIVAGITATGIVGGSYIANKMSKEIIDPLFNKGSKPSHKANNKSKVCLYDERKPELLDVALHTDDIATAGVLSGFKWIEPALPFMYFVSGYRAGIGYRNNQAKKSC